MLKKLYTYDVDLDVNTKGDFRESNNRFTGRFTDPNTQVTYNLGTFPLTTEMSNVLAVTLASQSGFDHYTQGYTNIIGDVKIKCKSGTIYDATYAFDNCSHYIKDKEFHVNGGYLGLTIKKYLEQKYGVKEEFTCTFSGLKASVNVWKSVVRYVQYVAPVVVPPINNKNDKPDKPVAKPVPVAEEPVEVDMGGLFGPTDGGDY